MKAFELAPSLTMFDVSQYNEFGLGSKRVSATEQGRTPATPRTRQRYVPIFSPWLATSEPTAP